MKRRLITVSLLSASALLLPLAGAMAQATTGRVTGTVTSSEGDRPMTGVRITVLGSQTTVTTNPQGVYTLTLAPGTYRLRASAIGYGPVQMDSVPVTANGTSTANFRLVRQTVQLEQVVVIGYGTQEKRDVTGAVSSVNAEAIRQQPTTNAIDAIKGRVPGVDITTTGYKPGDGVRVQIRGQRSMRASNDPLYVLDGVPMSGGIGDLNPQDIESIEVLKDASATAIYGSRGANGVVLVTSKRGIAGDTRISYDTYVGRAEAALDIPVFNGEQFAEYKREAYRAAGQYPCPGRTVCAAGDAATFYQQELDGIKNGTSIDYRDLILRTGSDLSHQVNVAGGNERTQFSVSANINANSGTTLGQDFRRRSMRVNFETQANDRIRVGGSALVLRSNQNVGPGDGVYGMSMRLSSLATPFDSAGNPLFRPYPDPLLVNPLYEINNTKDERLRTRAFGTIFGTVNFAPGLDFRVSFGPDISYERRGRFYGVETTNGLGQANVDNDQTFEYTLDNVLTYKRDIGTAHRIDATALYGIQQNRRERSNLESRGVPYETQYFYNLGTGATISGAGSNLTEWALQSYMGRINYAFQDKYLLTLTARVDGSSRLAKGKKYATFPSVAVGYRALDETKGQSFGPLDGLKLRASYGSTGNTSVDAYQTLGGLSRTAYTFGGTPSYGYRPGSLANPNLGWERTNQYDVGADFTMFGGRLTGTLDGYIQNTEDLLMNRVLPPISGYTSTLENIGATRNRGVELGLSHLTVNGWQGLNWTNDFTVSANRNEIVRLDTEGDNPNNRWFIGQPIDNNDNNRVWYDLRYIGIWQTADSALARRYGRAPGMVRVEDINGDSVINVQDRVIIGNNFPSWTGSWNTRMDFRGFDASAQLYTRRGMMLFNDFKSNSATLAGRYNGYAVNYWTPDNPSNTDPRPNKNQEFPVDGGTRAYEDGSFLRLRNITLGYRLPRGILGRVGAESVRIYGTATNIATWTNFGGLDPEGANDPSSTPPSRTLIVGANFGF